MRSLKDCKSVEEVAAIERDHIDRGDFYLGCDSNSVWLTEQRMNESPTQTITLPKKIFDQLVAGYTKPQKETKR